MKTTVEIPDALLRKAKQFAISRKLTLRDVLLAGLKVLLEHSKAQPYTLPDRSVQGRGLSPEFASTGWGSIRDAAYGLDKR